MTTNRLRSVEVAALCFTSFGMWSCGSAQEADGEAKVTGFAFVASEVTSQGSNAQLPNGTKIVAPGAKVTGTEGCPTDQYGTDGRMVAVIDYRGRPTAASLTINQLPLQPFGQRPPYYLDLNTGRTLQFLGPIAENGTYRVVLEWHFGQGETKSLEVEFTLDRSCPGA